MKIAESLSQSQSSLFLVSETPSNFAESHSFAVQNICKIKEVKGTIVLKYLLSQAFYLFWEFPFYF